MSNHMLRGVQIGHRLGGRAVPGILGGGLLLAAVLAHRQVADDWSATGPLLPLDRLFDLALVLGVLLLAVGLGLRLLAMLRLDWDHQTEHLLCATALGMGVLANLVLALALAGILWRPLLWLLLGVLAALVRREAGETLAQLQKGWRWSNALVQERRPRLWTLVASTLLAAIAASAGLLALTPPAETDALMYHLYAPRTFLESSRLVHVPFQDRLYFPLTVELLYVIPLSFGSDVAPRLLHFASGLLLAAAVAALAQRLYGGRSGGLALAVLGTIPAVAALAPLAYVDLTWSLFQTLALLAVLHWWNGGQVRWLALGGLFLGLALGSKYLALQAVLALVPVVVLGALRRPAPVGHLFFAGLALGIPAALVAAPWYVKNTLLTGNPFYPFFGQLFAGGLNLSGAWQDAQVLQGQNAGVGLGQSPLDYLLLPLNVFLHHTAFTYGHLPTVFSPLFLMIPLGLAAGGGRQAGPLSLFVVLSFGLWAVGVQEARYFLPGALILAAMTGGTLEVLLVRYRDRPLFRRAVLTVLLLVLGMATHRHIVQEPQQGYAQTLAFVVGAQSRNAYLEERLLSYPANRWVNERAASDDHVLMVRDSGGYYLRRPHLPDDLVYPRWLLPGPGGYPYPEQRQGRWQAAAAPTMEEALTAVQREGITLLVVSHIYLEGLGERYRTAIQRQEANLKDLVDRGRLEVLYSDRAFTVLRIRLAGPESRP